ncbi:glycosyltransferase family 8 protein [Macrolepiota fuliginosa MF-IS2]|uniref:glycogenin glucosyltransferase n=1 Tax=Macrolepiota fuliginosa MF-IS2 TaxID=1400762 RepID=A0A9P5XRN1_9AGAR|nr:glycosyltransferase family 8 protein [Macrolepiota fuliginosa MF-IS2]
MAGPYAFVTLISSDAYLPGALAQAAALRDVHPHPPVFPEVSFKTICLVTPETVDVATIKLLRRAFDLVIGVEVLEQDNNTNLELLGRPDLTTVLTKLHVFRLTQYSKIIFLDADVLPIRPLSHLFNIPHEFAAAPDVGWPDIFNSGVLVLSPGGDKFNDLNELLKSKGSWDGGDQGLLNEWRAGNWHRLSFTYNTTPTAAYTYAPAYERFGSQINAIHFIGSNKPWKSIPSRSPFLRDKSPTPEPRSSQQAYDYESLVDRWFTVYDKHYRSQPIVPPSFEVRHYSSAWDPPDSSSSVRAESSKPFSMEDLRRIAIQGMAVAGFEVPPPSGQQGEGEYQSMPLEGRFDLMRLKKAAEESEASTSASSTHPEPRLEINFADTESPMTSMAQHLGLPGDFPPWDTLPTPGPNEVPPSPKFRFRSLPPTPTPAPDYYASSAGQTSDSDAWPSAENPGDQGSQVLSQLFGQPYPALQLPSHDAPHGEPTEAQHHRHHHDRHNGHHHDHHHDPHHQHAKGDQRRHVQHQHDSPVPEYQQESIRRPPSPPLISWNPAVEPPPNTPPPPSGFPTDTYFKNVWDQTHRFPQTQKGTPEQSSELFQAPPLPQIPEALRAQGHYTNVTGEGIMGFTPSPDRSKVKPVFPWEDKPRQMPGRVFPKSDAPLPAHFSLKGRTSPTIPKTPERAQPPKKSPLLPPPEFPTTSGYSNAWDNVPGIKDYASRLARPPPVPALAPAFDDHLWRKDTASWDEKVEASSRDGDDEDEGDEDEEVGGADSDDDKRSQRRSRAPSAVEDTRQVQKSAQKHYYSQGVQTILREKRSQGIQVATLVEPPSRDRSRRSSASSKRSVGSGASIGREANHTSGPLTKPGASSTAGSIRPRSISNGSFGHPLFMDPASRAHRHFITSPSSVPKRPPSKPVTIRSPESPKVTTPPRIGTPQRSITPPKIHSPPKVSTPPARPSIQIDRHIPNPSKGPSIISHQISNDSSIGSPPSSVGPVSPPDDQPFTSSPIRKGTRVWDPARGVELFKRGSEEVLARFLKMGSWEENTR